MNLDNRKVVELNLNDILPNRFQPRIHFSEDAINELSESIKEHGVIQPIVVRQINDKYEIIAGERRYKASTMAGKKTIPAIVTDLNDKESAEIALIENVQREDLTPIEEAISYKKILNMGYLTQEDLSLKLGKKQSTISNKLRLLNLDETVQEALLEKKISERHARSLLKLENKDQKIMLDRIINERLTVRKTDAEIDKIIHSKNNVELDSDVIEVLDIEEIKDNKGEKNMNNEINNNFNIPTTPIIEDVPTPMPNIEPTPVVGSVNTDGQPISEKQNLINEQPQSSIFDTPKTEYSQVNGFNNLNTNIVNNEENISNVNNTQNAIAPGFMDIDKIQTQATDINIEKPTADLNSLLTPTPAPEEVKPTPVDTSIFGFTPVPPTNNQPTSEVEKPKVGKFFDLDSLGEIQEAASPDEATPESIEQLLNNSVVQPKEEEKPIVQEQTVPTENKSEMFGINLEPKNPDFVENIDKKEANLDFGEPKPVIDNNNLNFNQFYNEQPNSQPLNETMVSESASVVENDNIGIQPIIGEQILNNNLPQQEVEPVQAPIFPTPVTKPAEEVRPNPVNQSAYTIPTAEELDSFLTGLDSTTPLSQVASQTEAINNSVIETPSTQSVVKVDMEKVVPIIREAIDKISALGIKVDIDEFDFDDMYQAIIKIDK